MKIWSAIFLMAALMAACSGSDAPDLALPSFEEAEGELEDLVGEQFTAEKLPEQLRAAPNQPSGATILNSADTPTGTASGLVYWLQNDDHANIAVSRVAGVTDGVLTWVVDSVWQLRFAPDTQLTVGTHLCFPAPDATGLQGTELFTVTNVERTEALAAWTMSADGPAPYTDFDSLDCAPSGP